MRILHRHKKRGTEYELLGFGTLQSERWSESQGKDVEGHHWVEQVNVDGREVAIYRNVSDHSEIWVRPREEFEDGRFEVLFSEEDDEDWSGLADEIEQEALNN